MHDAVAKPSPREMKKAKALFEKAETAAALKEYLPSADYYLEAYALFPSPDFLFNAASMYRLAKEKELARKYFEQYLAMDPEGRGAAKATSVIAGYDAEREQNLERERRAKQKAEAKRLALLKQNKAASEGNSQARASKAGDDGSRPSALPAILGMSTGGLLVGVGIYFGLESKSISDEASKSTRYDPDLEKTGKEAERNAYIFGGFGATVIVGSAIYYLLQNREKPERSSLSFVPAANGESIGAFAYGQF